MAKHSTGPGLHGSQDTNGRKRQRTHQSSSSSGPRCNLCRARKLPCDGHKPSCRNCDLAHVVCVTTEPKGSSASSPTTRRMKTLRFAGQPTTYSSQCKQSVRPSTSSVASSLASVRPGISPEDSSSLTTADLDHDSSKLHQHTSDRGIGEPGINSAQHPANSHQGVDLTLSPYTIPNHLPYDVSTNVNRPPSFLQADHGCERTPRSFSRVEPQEGSRSSLQNSQVDEIQPFHVGNFDASPNDMSMAINSDQTNSRRQYVGSSSLQVFTQWLDLSFLALGPKQPTLSSRFAFGMRFAVEFDLPTKAESPKLPEQEHRGVLLDIYFRRIHPLFPVLDEADFRSSVDRLTSCQDLSSVTPVDRPLLACIYTVLSIASDEQAGQSCSVGTMYLDAAYALYASLVALPYLPSVQALLLLTIALCGKNKQGSSWHICGQAVRIGQAIGLHRRHNPHNAPSPGYGMAENELDSRVWWVMFCLEKILAFETGRPSMILDADIDQCLPKTKYLGVDCCNALIGLAHIQSQISTKLFRTCKEQKSAGQLIHDTGVLDQSLQQWAESLPDEIRPDRDLTYCSQDQFPFAAFIAFQYHQSIINLHRAALLLDTRLHRQQVDRNCHNERWMHRLRAGEALCVNSARCVVKILNEMLHKYGQSTLLTLTQPLLAIYVLAMQIIKHPENWSSQCDLLLLESALNHAEHAYNTMGIDPNFCTMLKNIRILASKCVTHAKSLQSTRAPTPENGLQYSAANDPKPPRSSELAQMPNVSVEFTAQRYARVDGLEDIPPQTTKGSFKNAPQDLEPVWTFAFGGDLLGATHDLGISTDKVQHLFGISTFDDRIDFDWT